MNRTNCCADRLTDFYVLVSRFPFNSQDLNATINQGAVSDYHFPENHRAGAVKFVITKDY